MSERNLVGPVEWPDTLAVRDDVFDTRGISVKHGTSPRITRIRWGRMDVEGLGSGRDMKLWPGGGREWDWGETGTHHVPGVQIADVEELVTRGSRIVVLSRGMELRLQQCSEALAYLEDRGVSYHVDETRAAVAKYNELAARGEPVGGLFHSTC